MPDDRPEPGTARAVLAEAGFDSNPRPWDEHAARGIEEHGAYADYAGFCEWFVKKLEPDWMDELEDAWEDMGELGRIALYSIMSGMCDETQ